MAGCGGRKTRGVNFGVALCFLAALFFVESKIAWAVVGNQCPTDIAAAKAQTADRSLGVPLRAEVKQTIRDHAMPTFAAAWIADPTRTAPPVQAKDLLAVRRQPRVPALIPFTQFVRPPPAR
jgi:hypothetical protein